MSNVVIKISGEFLKGSLKNGIDPVTCTYVSQHIKEVVEQGINVLLVLGGGNLWRGSSDLSDWPRYASDQMGMLATCMNCLALQQSLDSLGICAEIFSAIGPILSLLSYSPQQVLQCFSRGHVALLAGGTGRAFCTTDTAAAFSACEINADILLKGTNVDGVYTKDPHLFPDAKKISKASFKEILSHKYEVMDLTAFTLCMKNNVPIKIFSLLSPNSFLRALQDESFGTYIAD